MPAPTIEQLTLTAKKARSEGDDELYFHLKQQIKMMGKNQAPPRPTWRGVPQPSLEAIELVDGVLAEAASNARGTIVEPAPEPELTPLPMSTAWTRSCACDNPDCSCDLTARLDEWSGYIAEEPPAAAADIGTCSATTSTRLEQLESNDAGSVVRASWSEAETMVWHSQHLEQDSGSSDDDVGYTAPPSSQPGGEATGAANALSMLATLASELQVVPSAMSAAIWLARFQTNNFSLFMRCDAAAPRVELEPKQVTSIETRPSHLVIGGAVCPRTAILNHSCAPNCRLVTLSEPAPAAYGKQHTFMLYS